MNRSARRGAVSAAGARKISRLDNAHYFVAASQHRYFTYDNLSRLKTAKNPEQVNTSGQQVATTYDYDDASNLLTKTSPNGTSVGFTYDGLNREKTKTHL